MTPTPLASPFSARTDVARYTVRPREHRVFHTALDASDLFTSKAPAEITWSERELRVHMPVANGHFEERCAFHVAPLRPSSFERTLREGERVLRHEQADFASVVPKLPEATYPETMLPFLLRAHPLDGERRSLYAWICDRFVAKVYYEVAKKRVDVRVPAGSFETTEVVMYPDINDWVKLGSVVTKLIRPFLPKYHMWFAHDASGHHKLVRFEGSYGPPGAPEIILELQSP
ncbi:MAG TPA: hypothetical protein VGH28_02925 [Polyangiaceae bacterium]